MGLLNDKSQNEFTMFFNGEHIKIVFDNNGYIVETMGIRCIMWCTENQEAELIGKHITEFAKMLKERGTHHNTYVNFLEGVVLKFYESKTKVEKENITEKVLVEENCQKDECKEINKHPISRLDHDVVSKIIQLQGIILEKKQKCLSIEKVIEFLNSAMNYDEFQIWLLENQMNGIKLSTNEKLKKFLEETSIDKILMLYDIEQNDDDKNLENIMNQNEKGPILKKI